MAALDVNTCMTNIRTLISGLTTWQTITGTSSATDSAKYIFRGGFRVQDESPENEISPEPPYCILDIEDLNANWKQSRFHATFGAMLWFELAVPQSNQSTYETQYIWVWQQLSGILADINSGVQDGGQLMSEAISLVIKPGLVTPEENSGRCDWRFALGLEGNLI